MADQTVSLDLLINAAQSAKSVAELQKSIRDLKDAAIEAGNNGNQALANKFTEAAGKATNQLKLLNQQIQFSRTGAYQLSALAAVGQSIAGGFAAAQGAAALFGASNKDLANTLVKVQAATALATGAQSLANAGKDIAIVKQALLNSSLAIGAAATAAYGTVVGVLTGEITIATAAQLAWDTAVNAFPLTGLATAISLAALAVYQLATRVSDAEIAYTKMTKAMDDNMAGAQEDAKVMDDLAKKHKQYYDDLIGYAQAEGDNYQTINGLKEQSLQRQTQDIQNQLRAQNELLEQSQKEHDYLASLNFNDLSKEQQQDVSKRLTDTGQIIATTKQRIDYLTESINQLAIQSKALDLDNLKSIFSDVISGDNADAAKAAAGTKAQLDAQLKAIDDATIEKLNTEKLSHEQEIELQANADKQKQNLTDAFNDKQLQQARDHQLALLAIQQGQGTVSPADAAQKKYNIEKEFLDKELSLYKDNATKEADVRNQLDNLNGQRAAEILADQQSRTQANEALTESELKAGYDNQLALLVTSDNASKTEIAENNIKKLKLEQQYQQDLLALQLKAAQDKLKTIPKTQTNADGTITQTAEYTSQVKVIQDITNQINEGIISGKQQLNSQLKSLGDTQYQDAVSSLQDSLTQQAAIYAQQYSDGTLNASQYQDDLANIKQIGDERLLDLAKEYAGKSKAADDDVSKKEIDNANKVLDAKKRTLDLQKQAVNDVLGAIGTIAENQAGKSIAAQKKAFEINKQASAAQAAISTYLAAQNVLQLPPVGLGPVAGIPAAVAIVVAGLANVAKIESQKFEGGGDTSSSSSSVSSGGAPSLTPTGGNQPVTQLGAQNDTLSQQQLTKVFVTETDISKTQGRINTLYNRALIH